MPFQVSARDDTTSHHWIMASAPCVLTDPKDALVEVIASAIRDSYGEDDLMLEAENLLAEEIEAGEFEMTNLLNAMRDSLPSPDMEATKRPHLANFRSEALELVARQALKIGYDFEFPTAAQRGKANANMPILGYDGWGFKKIGTTDDALVLIQVKGTDDIKCPPRVSHELAEECIRVPKESHKIARALMITLNLLKDDRFKKSVYKMLERLGANQLPIIYIAPVVVRGIAAASADDLSPVRTSLSSIPGIEARGAVVAINVDLTEFGRVVMRKAREAV